MTKYGYAISSEEHHPQDIVRHAQLAEAAGFPFALISDHYHPWVSTQGHSPFVWSVIGALAQATKRLVIGTGVTAPIIRIHPAIIAQAAATSAAMLPNRFFLGVGTGENLNEHVTGQRWPPHDVRLAMLAEAVAIMRMLWTGETQSYWGRFFTVEDARLFTLPEALPQVMVAASGPKMAASAGQFGDGLISTSPDKETVESFTASGGQGKPIVGQLTVCYAPSKQEARRTVHHIWPNAGLTGELNVELRTVTHFEQAVKLVTEETATKDMPCGPDPEEHIAAIRKYIDAGYDHVYIHQIGPDQEGFLRFYAREVLPDVA
jgi:G6PDH family F420-dependent oxidoreductase